MPLPNDDNRDLPFPFPLFFFQRREGVGGRGRLSTTHDSTEKATWACHIFPRLYDKKNNQKGK
jgi:hypothetical protein